LVWLRTDRASRHPDSFHALNPSNPLVPPHVSPSSTSSESNVWLADSHAGTLSSLQLSSVCAWTNFQPLPRRFVNALRVQYMFSLLIMSVDFRVIRPENSYDSFSVSSQDRGPWKISPRHMRNPDMKSLETLRPDQVSVLS